MTVRYDMPSIPKIPVPVFMYHTVGVVHDDWLWRYLTVDYRVFDHHMAILKRLGCHSVSLQDLYDHVASGKRLPKNAFVLTFDDGYLDNWVAAAPIMRKYGFRGTVYVNPEFVDPATRPRPTLEDMWAGRVTPEELTWRGFLSWAEMRELNKDGTLDIQSHAMSHTWYFKGPKLVDFRHPGDEYVWMSWNRHPGMKHAYMFGGANEDSQYGLPIYEYGKSLQVHRFFPNVEIDQALTSFVHGQGGGNFFQRDGWREELMRVYSEASSGKESGYWESDSERNARVDYELLESKRTIERQLNKPVDFLCWPGGGYDEYAMERAKAIYRAVTLGSGDRTDKKNAYGEDPALVKRVGIPYVSHGDDLGTIKYLGGYSIYLTLRSFQGKRLFNYLRKAAKAVQLIRMRLTVVGT